MKQHSTQAIILRRINFGEADRILTVLTSEHGKMSILAKGARRAKSKLAGGLELFSVSDITFIDGKSELKTVVSTQLIKYYSKIVGNMQSTMIAYEFLKLIDTLTQASCDEQYFNLLSEGLQALDEHLEQPDIVYVWFVTKLLGLTGFAINLESQVDNSDFDEEKMYHFSFEDMGFFAHPSGQFGPKHIKFLRLLQKVSKPGNLIHVEDSKLYAQQLRPLLQQCTQIAA